MINISTLLYILDLWTICLKTEIGFRPNILFKYQVSNKGVKAWLGYPLRNIKDSFLRHKFNMRWINNEIVQIRSFTCSYILHMNITHWKHVWHIDKCVDEWNTNLWMNECHMNFASFVIGFFCYYIKGYCWSFYHKLFLIIYVILGTFKIIGTKGAPLGNAW